MSQKQKDAMIKYIQEVGQLVKGKNKLHWQVGFFPSTVCINCKSTKRKSDCRHKKLQFRFNA